MNKDRLNLCKSFTNAKTLSELKWDKDQTEYERKKANLRLNRELNNLLKRMAYQKRPWYKKLWESF